MNIKKQGENMPLIEKPDLKELKKFGFLFTLFSGILITFLYFVHSISSIWFIIPVFVLLITIVYTPFLLLLYYFMRGLGYILGFINTRILLSLFFFILLTPISLIMRLFGKKFYKTRPDIKVHTYWIDRKNPHTDYNKQF